MKRIVFAALLLVFLTSTTPVLAKPHGKHNPKKVVIIKNIDNSRTINKTEVTEVTEVKNTTNVVNEAEEFDYGPMLDLILVETETSEWGIRASHEIESEETRVMFGGKIYLNRILNKKTDVE